MTNRGSIYNDGCVTTLFADASIEDYKKKIKEYEVLGFEEYDSFRVRDNYHLTMIKGEVLLQIYYNECSDEIRIIEDRFTYLCNKKSFIEQGATGDTTLYQLELDYSNIDCGMCYIVKCPDDSLFVIDSAHQNSVNDHVRIHDFMRKITPEGKRIRIAGWFFSHAHQDHIVKFMDFLRADFDDVDIEMLYYNFPSLDCESAKYWKEDDRETMREFFELMDERSDLKKIRLHTGQRFFVSNLKFEVLFTHEDLFPLEIKRFNDSSTVLMMEAEGCKVFFPGDAGEEASYIMHARYGNKLKSDIVQVSHHGFRGCTPGIYTMVQAPVALYSTFGTRREENSDRPANIRLEQYAKEVYVAADGTVELKLPYKLGTAKVYPQEIVGNNR